MCTFNQTKTIKKNKRLKPEDLKDNSVTKLRYVKFQNVQNITVCSNYKFMNILFYSKKDLCFNRILKCV